VADILIKEGVMLIHLPTSWALIFGYSWRVVFTIITLVQEVIDVKIVDFY